MMYAELPTAGRFPGGWPKAIRRKRPNGPAVDNTLRASWRPLKGDQFIYRIDVSTHYTLNS